MICGHVPLLEAEGCEEVDGSLKLMFPDDGRRPTILFYDKACVLGRLLERAGETRRGWKPF